MGSPLVAGSGPGTQIGTMICPPCGAGEAPTSQSLCLDQRQPGSPLSGSGALGSLGSLSEPPFPTPSWKGRLHGRRARALLSPRGPKPRLPAGPCALGSIRLAARPHPRPGLCQLPSASDAKADWTLCAFAIDRLFPGGLRPGTRAPRGAPACLREANCRPAWVGGQCCCALSRGLALRSESPGPRPLPPSLLTALPAVLFGS